MKKLITILILMSHLQAIAATPLYYAPLTNPKDRNAYSRVQSDQFETFSKKFITETPRQKNANDLLEQFELAQKYYLVKSFTLAKDYYLKVVAFQDRDEWKDIHRKMIFLSFIRLSELDHNESWMQKAVAFSPDMDTGDFDFTNDQNDKIKSIKKELNAKAFTWSVQSLQKDFSYILLNGHVIDLSQYENIRIPAGTYRLTYLSEIYKPQTYQITAQQIPFIEPSRIPFVSGDCEHPQFNNEGEDISSLAIYYSDTCVQYFQNNHWTRLNQNNSNLPAKEVVQFTTTDNTQSIPHETISYEVEEKPFYRKPWFWILAATMAAGAIIYTTQKKNTEPSHDILQL